MKINPYQPYTTMSNEGMREVSKTNKPIIEQIQKVEESEPETVLDEYEILTQLNDHYDLVQKKMVFFGGTVLQTVVTDPNKVDLLKKAMDSLEQSYENTKNHAIASGDELEHFSANINKVSGTDSFALEVETWSKLKSPLDNVTRFNRFDIEKPKSKQKNSTTYEKTINDEKNEAKEQFSTGKKSTGAMVYEVTLMENTSNSNVLCLV